MKYLIVFVAIVAVSSAQFFGQPSRRSFSSPPRPAPRPIVARAAAYSGNDATANVVRYDNDINPDGSYQFAYETDNGIAAQAKGTVRNFGGNPPASAAVAEGSYSYTSPEGVPVSITYVADENGFQPTGDLLPVGPPIPPQIARALEYLAKYAPQQRKK